jgi:hypothetical protein
MMMNVLKKIQFSIEYEEHYNIHKRTTLVNISIQTDEANVIIFYSLHSIIIKTRPLVICWDIYTGNKTRQQHELSAVNARQINKCLSYYYNVEFYLEKADSSNTYFPSIFLYSTLMKCCEVLRQYDVRLVNKLKKLVPNGTGKYSWSSLQEKGISR